MAEVNHERLNWFHGRLSSVTPGRIRRGRGVKKFYHTSRYFVRCLWVMKGIGKRHRILIDYIMMHTAGWKIEIPNKDYTDWNFNEIGRITGLKQNLSRVSNDLKKKGIIRFSQDCLQVQVNFKISDWVLDRDEWKIMQAIIDEEFPASLKAEKKALEQALQAEAEAQAELAEG